MDPQVSTSYTVVINPPGVDRIFLHYPGANDTFGADDVRYDLLAQARLFHFGYPPLMRLMYEDDGAQLVEILRRAKETGVTTSLDMALPDASSPAGRADWAAILKRRSLTWTCSCPASRRSCSCCAAKPIASSARRRGRQHPAADHPGAALRPERRAAGHGREDRRPEAGPPRLLPAHRRPGGHRRLGRARPSDPAAWADQELWAPCFQVDVVGTTGSGDSTIAGFLCALLRDMAPDQAVTAAVAVGACNVEAADALSGIRPWDETMRRVAAGWARHPLNLDAPGWHFDEPADVGRGSQVMVVPSEAAAPERGR